MERARATWTDERLDDLAKRMDDGFRRVDQDVRELRAEMNAQFGALEEKLGGRIDGLDAKLGARIDGLGRTMIIANATIIASVLATLAAVIVKV